MDAAQFESRLFAHLEEHSLVLTPINVGYTFDIEPSDAVSLMDALVDAGKLENVSGQGTSATYRVTGKATVGTSPSEVSVSGPTSSQAMYHAFLNFFIPGLGSLIYKKPIGSIVPLLLVAGAVVLVVFLGKWSMLFSLIPLAVAWIWSVIAGIVYYVKDPWSRNN